MRDIVHDISYVRILGSGIYVSERDGEEEKDSTDGCKDKI